MYVLCKTSETFQRKKISVIWYPISYQRRSKVGIISLVSIRNKGCTYIDDMICCIPPNHQGTQETAHSSHVGYPPYSVSLPSTLPSHLLPDCITL